MTSTDLQTMPNVGKVLAENLLAVGIETPEQLSQVGSKDAFIRIRATVDPGACLHMLYGLQGAIDGVPDTRLSDATKADLRRFHRDLARG
jgi:DNA transformation protein and related proteins